MMQKKTTTAVKTMPARAMTTIYKPNCQSMTWLEDDGFTDDLLLAQDRPCITSVKLSRSVNQGVTIQVLLENQTANKVDDLRIHAVIQDDHGTILTRRKQRLVSRVSSLQSGQTMDVSIAWIGSETLEPYHVLLVVEDAHGTMLDTLSGSFYTSHVNN